MKGRPWIGRIIAGLALLLLAVLAAATLLRNEAQAPDDRVVAASKPDALDPAPQIGAPRITFTRTHIREVDETPVGRLVEAARQGRVDEIRGLLGEGASPMAADVNGDMPLHRAAWAAAPEALDLLLAAGADPDAPDGRGWYPLSYAILAGSLACTERLLAVGAEVRAQIPEGSPLEPLISGWLAAEAGIPDAPAKRESERVEVARAILEAGGTSGAGEVLDRAITLMKSEELVAVLLDHGARLDTSTRTGSALMRLRGPIGDRLRAAAELDAGGR